MSAFDSRLNHDLVSITYVPDGAVGSGVASITDCSCMLPRKYEY